MVFELNTGYERLEEKHPVCAEATTSAEAGGGRETGRSSVTQEIPKGCFVHGSPWLSACLALHSNSEKSKAGCSNREEMISHAMCNLPLL